MSLSEVNAVTELQTLSIVSAIQLKPEPLIRITFANLRPISDIEFTFSEVILEFENSYSELYVCHELLSDEQIVFVSDDVEDPDFGSLYRVLLRKVEKAFDKNNYVGRFGKSKLQEILELGKPKQLSITNHIQFDTDPAKGTPPQFSAILKSSLGLMHLSLLSQGIFRGKIENTR